MNIVYATDDKGVLGTGVSIVSLMENLPKEEKVRVYILTAGLNRDNVARLQSLERYSNLCIVFIHMGEQFNNFPVGASWSTPTYYRLVLSSVLPPDVERALYVDIDVVFNKNIAPMYYSEFHHCLIAGVFTTEHLPDTIFERWKKEMDLGREATYINAGVILYNIKGIREEQFDPYVLSYAQENIHHLSWQDQDVLNKCYQGRILLLHPMWNICDGAIWSIRWENLRRFKQNPLTEKELLEAATQPGIIHYWGLPKPWHPNSIRHDYGLFNKYWRLSPWSDLIKQVKKKNNSIRLTTKRLRSIYGKGVRFLQGKHR